MRLIVRTGAALAAVDSDSVRSALARQEHAPAPAGAVRASRCTNVVIIRHPSWHGPRRAGSRQAL